MARARTGDRHVYAARSRFIPDELLGLFNARLGQRLLRNPPLQVRRGSAFGLMSAPACSLSTDIE